jgi:hypothetical protein
MLRKLHASPLLPLLALFLAFCFTWDLKGQEEKVTLSEILKNYKTNTSQQTNENLSRKDLIVDIEETEKVLEEKSMNELTLNIEWMINKSLNLRTRIPLINTLRGREMKATTSGELSDIRTRYYYMADALGMPRGDGHPIYMDLPRATAHDLRRWIDDFGPYLYIESRHKRTQKVFFSLNTKAYIAQIPLTEWDKLSEKEQETAFLEKFLVSWNKMKQNEKAAICVIMSKMFCEPENQDNGNPTGGDPAIPPPSMENEEAQEGKEKK